MVVKLSYKENLVVFIKLTPLVEEKKRRIEKRREEKIEYDPPF